MENIKISNYECVAQLDEHESSKFADAGSNPVTPKKCEYCGLEFSNWSQKANHIRWKHKKVPSTSQMKSEKWIEAMKLRRGKTKSQSKIHCVCNFCGKEWDTYKEQFTRHLKICKLNPNRIVPKGHRQSEETKKKLSEKALKNSYRRIMRHTQEYKGVLYDSSWEVEFAKRLETLGEPFERPSTPILYVDDDGKEHNYFPDFYLTKRMK